VVEATGRVGGKLRTSPIEGVDVDEGAEQVLARTPEAVELAAAVGLGERVVHPSTSHASVWSRGALRPLPARTVLGVPSSVRSLRGVLSAGEVARTALDYVLPAAWASDDVSVADHVGSRLGPAVVERLVDPLLGGVYAGSAGNLSLAATLPQLAGAKGSLITAARAVTRQAPAGPVFATLRGGLQQLADAVALASGAQIVLRRTVRSIARTATGFRVVHGPTIDEQALDAHAVVVATPAAATGRLLAKVAPAAAMELASVEAASVAIVTLAFATGEGPAAAGSGYLSPAVEGRCVKAATFSSAKWPHLRGEVDVVRCSIGRYGEVGELQRDDEELVAAAAADLREVAGATGTPMAWRVTRWGGALPQYAVGHLDRVRRVRAAVAEVPGLAVCGAAYDGVGIPACIRSARAAAASIRASLEPRPNPSWS
jgi:oxygen-dependent protoporphyrinogen oxidase